jgi:hypothetical protein
MPPPPRGGKQSVDTLLRRHKAVPDGSLGDAVFRVIEPFALEIMDVFPLSPAYAAPPWISDVLPEGQTGAVAGLRGDADRSAGPSSLPPDQALAAHRPPRPCWWTL